MIMESYWYVELVNVGREKVCKKIKLRAPSLDAVEQFAIKECGKYLRSRDIDLTDNLDLTYSVTAGFHTVGQVQITVT